MQAAELAFPRRRLLDIDIRRRIPEQLLIFLPRHGYFVLHVLQKRYELFLLLLPDFKIFRNSPGHACFLRFCFIFLLYTR